MHPPLSFKATPSAKDARPVAVQVACVEEFGGGLKIGRRYQMHTVMVKTATVTRGGTIVKSHEDRTGTPRARC